MEDYDVDKALDIVTYKISQILGEYAISKDKEKSDELKKKLDVLEEIKEQVYLNNKLIIQTILDKNEKGLI